MRRLSSSCSAVRVVYDDVGMFWFSSAIFEEFFSLRVFVDLWGRTGGIFTMKKLFYLQEFYDFWLPSSRWWWVVIVKQNKHARSFRHFKQTLECVRKSESWSSKKADAIMMRSLNSTIEIVNNIENEAFSSHVTIWWIYVYICTTIEWKSAANCEKINLRPRRDLFELFSSSLWV